MTKHHDKRNKNIINVQEDSKHFRGLYTDYTFPQSFGSTLSMTPALSTTVCSHTILKLKREKTVHFYRS